MSRSATKRLALSMALGLAVGLPCAQPSSAVTATVTYKGQASAIYDPTGLFGTASPSLFSAAFVDVFKLDLSKGILHHYNFSGVLEDQLLGGSIWFAPSPVVTSKLTINGHSVDFSGDQTGQEINSEGASIGSSAISGASAGQSGLITWNLIDIRTDAPLSLFAPYSGVADPLPPFQGSFIICDFIATSSNSSSCSFAGETLNGSLTPESVTVRIGDGVPEPASWLLMLCGFGGVAAVMRSRRRITATA